MTSLIPSVTLVDGHPRVSSLDIAEKFGKRHCDVLRTVQKIMSELSPEFTERNFALNKYFDEIGRKLPMYHLTRDAFSLVAMGFTGKEALAWKVRYIEAFNAMEKELLKKAAPALPAASAKDPYAEAEDRLEEMRRKYHALRDEAGSLLAEVMMDDERRMPPQLLVKMPTPITHMTESFFRNSTDLHQPWSSNPILLIRELHHALGLKRTVPLAAK